MFSELTWLGAVLLGLGVLIVGVPAFWVIQRGVRDRADARDPFGSWRRGESRFRRVPPKDDQQ